MHRRHTATLFTILALAHGASNALAIEADAAALWSGKVQALFDVQCVKCHGPIEQKSALELDTPEAVMKGSEFGPVVVPGKPEESLLYTNLEPKADPHMPPKKQLTDEERAIVREWIVALGKAPKKSAAPVVAAPRHFESSTAAIDTLVAEGWEKRKIQPAPALDDSTWCRRVYLDLAGRIPTQAEVAAFLAASADTRRQELVDSLLASDEYVVRMRELWDVFLMGRGRRDNTEDRRKRNGWFAFLETAFRNNRPWNDTVRDMLVARADSPESKGSSWFLYERRNEHQRIAEAVAPLVYGTTIDCAQCHDHPLAREIKQSHYWGLVAAFNRSKNVEGGNAVSESAIGGFVNFTNLKKESQPAIVTLLNGKTIQENRPAGGEKEKDSDENYVDPKAKARVPKVSRREQFADAATIDNPLLARAFVNRMWAAFLGRGIVHPVDEMNERNQPSHPELLDWLAKDFVEKKYDARGFIRAVVLSKPYALGAGPIDKAPAPDAFAASLERPLTGEQIARSWRVAAGADPADDALRKAAVSAMPDVLPRDYNATFQQAQFLTNSPVFAGLLKAGGQNTTARIAALPDDPARAEAAFLAAYGRKPDAGEAERVTAFLASRSGKPEEGTRDLLWALLTSAEFLTMP